MESISIILVSIFARLRLGLGTVWKLSVSGLENLPETPFMVCSNHCSHMDSGVLILALPHAFDDAILVAATDYHFDGTWRAKVIKQFFNLAPLNRQRPRGSLDRCADVCSDFLSAGGKTVLMFPEGTRSEDGSIRPFRRGAAVLANKLELKIVPAHIDGSFELFPKHSFFLRPGRLTVRFGKPVDPADFPAIADSPLDIRSAEKELTAEVERQVRALAAQAAQQRKD